MQQFKLLRPQVHAENRQPGGIAAWPVEAGDKTSRNRVDAGGKDDRNGLGGRYHRPHGSRVAADQHGCDAATDEVDRHPGHPVILTFGPAILDCDVPALDEADFGEAAPKCVHVFRPFHRRHAVEDPDHRHRLLRARRERPRYRRAAEERDEMAAFQLIELHSVPHQPGPDCKISNWRGSVWK